MGSAFSWFLARRYLLSRRVNLLGMIGIAVSVWAMIVVIAVFSGFIGEIRRGIHNASPDLVLTGMKAPCDYAAVAPILQKDPDVAALAPRVEHYGIIYAYGYHDRFVQTTRAIETGQLSRNFVRVLGVDVTAERDATELHAWLEAAPDDLRTDDPDHPFGISPARMARAGNAPAVGTIVARPDGMLMSARRLTKGERIEIGSRVDVVSGRFTTGSQGSALLKSRHPTVLTGAFASGHRTFDESAVLVDIEFLRRMLGFGADESDLELCTQIVVRARPGADAAKLAVRLAAAVAGTCGGQVLTWEEQNATFLGAVDRERTMMTVCLFAVMLVAAFLIYATLHMMVVQKIRDIGVLTAMGATPYGVQMIFLLSGAIIALLGAGSGVALGVASTVYLNPLNELLRTNFGVELFPTDVYALDKIPYELDPTWVAQVAAAATILALLVAWLPARRAARMRPVQALAHS